MKKTLAILVALTCVTCYSVPGHAADETGVMRKLEDNQFATKEGLPDCVTMAVESGDPATGASVIVFKAADGCQIPWHWHTPTENVMVVSGSAKVEMKDMGAAVDLGPGGYAMMPGHHIHQFTCTSGCTAFVSSDAAFDIHYVDADGKEIPADAALKKK